MVDALNVQEPFGRSELVARGVSALDDGGLTYLGPPGSGRSSLLRAVVARVPDRVVLSVRGLPDESEMSYAGLQRLLAPFAGDGLNFKEDVVSRRPADRIFLENGRPGEAVPDGEHRSSRGRLAGARHDGFVQAVDGWSAEGCRLQVGMSVAALLRAMRARCGPVVCVVDDAEMLDFPSWQLIKLAVRRAGVPLLATALDSSAGREIASGLVVRHVGPLDDRAGHALLRRAAPDIADEVAAAVIELAAGNPGALVELGESLTAEQRRGFSSLPATLPRSSALGHRLRAAVAALPSRTRELLLLAAAPPRVSVGELAAAHRSAEAAGLDDLAPAERAGLVDVVGAEVRFCPPVLRSVIYQDAPIGRRRAAHLALSRAGGRRLTVLLHRAAVASAPDEELARELREASAGAAPAEAAMALRYASELTADPGPALLGAAGAAWAAGRPQDALPLLRLIAGTDAPVEVRARARGLIAEVRLRGDPIAARDSLLDVVATLLPADFPGALEALLLAGEACCRAGEGGRFTALAREAERQAAEARPAGRWDAGGELALQQIGGIADLLDGADDSAFGHFRAVLDLADRVDDPRLLIPAAMAGVLIGRDDCGARIAERAAGLARATGVHVLVPSALEAVAYAEMAAGRYAAATDAALDGAAAARRAARPDLADTHLALLSVLAALVGDRASAQRRAAEAGARHEDARDLCEWADALLDLVEGRPGDAAGRLGGIVAGHGSAVLRVAVVPHLVEAAGTAAPPVESFDRWAGRTGQAPWLALRARCRALRTSDGEAADDHFREALRRHERGFARAHTELLYGSHLRRRRRHLEAREHLRLAAETFHRLDAAPWAAHATRELRAAGDRVPAVAPAPGPPLTAQQERIAGLVADGATNREVAQLLHLSPRTVDHHLRNVFARLGVRSRTELARLRAENLRAG